MSIHPTDLPGRSVTVMTLAEAYAPAPDMPGLDSVLLASAVSRARQVLAESDELLRDPARDSVQMYASYGRLQGVVSQLLRAVGTGVSR